MRVSRRERIRKMHRRTRRLRLESLENRRVLATYFVDTVADTSGICAADNASGNSNCSLRSAIESANANPGADIVQVPDGTYLLNSGSGSLTASGEDLQIIGNAASPSAVVIDGVNQARVFDLFGSGSGDVNVELRGLTIQNGVANDGSGGGGILVGADINLLVNNVVLQNNVAADMPPSQGTESSGGAIQAQGNLTILDSVLRNNQATLNGGGVALFAFDVPKTLTVTSSSFEGNRADSDGGGIFINGGNTSLIVNGSTIDNNEAGDSGGGLVAIGSVVDVTNGFFSNNRALGTGGVNLGLGGGAVLFGQTPGRTALFQGSTFDRNTALRGGAIASEDANVRLENSVVEANQATGTSGGGIDIVQVSLSPKLTLFNSTVFANQAATNGGGLSLQQASLEFENLTVSGNDASGSGGGISYQNANSGAPSEIRFSTIASNTSLSLGANIDAQGMPLTFIGSILADGDSNGSAGVFVSGGGNIDAGSSTGLNDPSDRINTDPLLGPLQDNGAGIPTHALLAGSPAIDTGPTPHPAQDARGVTRPADGNGDSIFVADVGAFEADSATPALLSIADVAVDENLGVATINVVLDNAVAGGFSVDVNLSAIAPASPSDFTNVPATLIFSGNAGETQSLTFTIFDDAIVEPSENIQVALGNVSNTIVDISDTALVTINDDDTTVITIDDLSVPENSPQAFVTIHSTHEVQGGVEVQLATSDGTATSGQDYQVFNSNLVLSGPGPRSVNIPLINDLTTERLETFVVSLTGATPLGGTPAPVSSITATDSGTVFLEDDDVARIFVAEDIVVAEDTGLAQIQLTLVGNVDAPFDLDFHAFEIPANVPFDYPGRAAAGTDFALVNQVVPFSGVDGETVTVSVSVTPDGVVEADESLISFANNIRAGGRNVHFDFSPNVSLSETNVFDTLDDAFHVQVQGDIAYVGAGPSGVELLDVSDPNNISSLGTFDTPGDAVHLQAIGNTVYVADSLAGLVILDTGDPSNISQIGQLDTTGSSSHVVVRGTTAYLSDGAAGLQIVDVSNPNSPALVGSFDTPGLATASEVGISNRVYVADGTAGLQVLDVSDPGNVLLLGSFDTTGTANSVSLFGNETHALVADGIDGVVLLDLGDLNNISEAARLDTVGEAVNVSTKTHDGLTIVSDGTGGLRIIEVHVPNVGPAEIKLPLALATPFGAIGNLLGTSGTVNHIDVVGRTGFVADGAGGVRVIDLLTAEASVLTIANDDSATINVVGSDVNESTGALDVTLSLSGTVDTGFTLQAATMDLVNQATSTGASIDFSAVTQQLSFSGTDGETRTITIPVNADLVVEPDEQVGFAVGDLQVGGRDVSLSYGNDIERVEISLLRSLSTSQGVQGIAVAGETLYAALGTDGTIVVDATAANNLTQISGVDGIDFASAVSTIGPNAVVASGSTGVQVLDTENLMNLRENDLIDTAGVASDVQLIGSTIYVANGDAGLLVIDAADPDNPIVTSLDTPGTANAVHVVGTSAFVADGASGLQIVDVSDPGSLTLLGSFDTLGDAIELDVVDGIAYIADSNTGIQILDVNDPGNVIALGSVGTVGNAVAVEVVGSIGYVLDDGIGLQVFDVSVPASVVSLGTFVTTGTPNAISVVGTTAYVGDSIGLNALEITPVIVAGSIINDDNATITIADVTVNETAGAASVVVSVDREVQGGFDLDVSTVDGDAIAPGDYAAVSTTLNFTGSAGETQTITLSVVDDGLPEADEIFTVQSTGFTAASTLASDAIDFADTGIVNLLSAASPTAVISGHVTCDANGNGIEDSGEVVVGAMVFLDIDGNRELDASELSTITDSFGNYQFHSVNHSNVTVVTEVPNLCNTIPTAPGVIRSIIDVGDLARAITSIDIDSDGDRDLVVASDRSASLAVLQNNGGEFTLVDELVLGNRPHAVDAWHSGSQPHVVVAGVGTPADGGSIYTVRGSVVSESDMTGGPIDILVDDVNQDGVGDNVFAALRSSDLHLQLGGEGNSTEVIANGNVIRAVASGDFNGDSSVDLVWADFGYEDDEFGSLNVLRGDGAGGFEAVASIQTPKQLVDVAAQDLNRDGTDEIILLTEIGQVLTYQFLNQRIELAATTDIHTGAIGFDFGDFNRDGETDVAIANLGDQRIELMVGDGTGRFALITTIENVSAPSDLVVDDFDGDGLDDIAVSNLYTDASFGTGSTTPLYQLPSTATILRLDLSESAMLVTGNLPAEVDFVFPAADTSIRFDINGDNEVSALDALLVVNQLAQSSQIAAEGEFVARNTDVSGDGVTTAVDALMIINHLDRQLQRVNPVSTILDRAVGLPDPEGEVTDDVFAAIDLVLSGLQFATLG